MKTFNEFLEQEIKAAGLTGLHFKEPEAISSAVVAWLLCRLSSTVVAFNPDAASNPDNALRALEVYLLAPKEELISMVAKQKEALELSDKLREEAAAEANTVRAHYQADNRSLVEQLARQEEKLHAEQVENAQLAASFEQRVRASAEIFIEPFREEYHRLAALLAERQEEIKQLNAKHSARLTEINGQLEARVTERTTALLNTIAALQNRRAELKKKIQQTAATLGLISECLEAEL